MAGEADGEGERGGWGSGGGAEAEHVEGLSGWGGGGWAGWERFGEWARWGRVEEETGVGVRGGRGGAPVGGTGEAAPDGEGGGEGAGGGGGVGEGWEKPWEESVGRRGLGGARGCWACARVAVGIPLVVRFPL